MLIFEPLSCRTVVMTCPFSSNSVWTGVLLSIVTTSYMGDSLPFVIFATLLTFMLPWDDCEPPIDELPSDDCEPRWDELPSDDCEDC